jgi:hypothetical protein
MTPDYSPARGNAHGESDRAGTSIHVDVVALATRLEEFDRRISEVKARHVQLDAKTAASVLQTARSHAW